MPRNDARTQRAMAVARVVQGERNGLRATIEKAAAAQKAPQRQVSPKVRAERAASEIATFARRLTPQDLATIDALHSRGGWPAVAQALSQAGLGADALRAAGAVAQRDGLPALGQAVRQEIQREDNASLQASAEPAAAAVLASLSPADYAEAARIYAAGGPEALAARAVQLGMHPAAAVVAVRTLETHGIEGARQVAVERVHAAEERAAEQEADKRGVEALAVQEGDSAPVRAVKEGSPLVAMARDPAFRAAAGDIAKRLEAAGVQRPANQSAAQFVIDQLSRMDGGNAIDNMRKPFDSRWTQEQKISAAAEVLGGTSVPAVRRFLSTFKNASEGHKLIARMAQSDAKRPGPPPKAAPNDLRDTITAAAAKHGTKAEPIAVGNARQAAIALAAGHKWQDLRTSSTHADKDIEAFATRLERPEPGPETSVRHALEHAIATHSTDEDEERTTTDVE